MLHSPTLAPTADPTAPPVSPPAPTVSPHRQINVMERIWGYVWPNNQSTQEEFRDYSGWFMQPFGRKDQYACMGPVPPPTASGTTRGGPVTRKNLQDFW